MVTPRRGTESFHERQKSFTLPIAVFCNSDASTVSTTLLQPYLRDLSSVEIAHKLEQAEQTIAIGKQYLRDIESSLLNASIYHTFISVDTNLYDDLFFVYS